MTTAPEVIIRPFVGDSAAPTPFHPGGPVSAPPVRLSIGLTGGSKTFGWSQSSTLSSYMAQVNTEKSVTAFDMESGKVK
jgi:hypothetical protein